MDDKTEFESGSGSEGGGPEEGRASDVADNDAAEGAGGNDDAPEGAEPEEPEKPRPRKASSKTEGLDALLDSLNRSAARFQTLWFSFLGLTVYLAIAALTTTHRNLLLREAQTLPILNIKVPLLPFYIIAPLIYLVFHFYLLMMLALLARTAAEFDKQLRAALSVEAERERYRARVENALFLQLLVGMKGERSGVNAVVLGLIALITIVLAPLATLILMQMMFLPYHHLRITWWHRGIVVADLVLVVVMTYRCFFPRGIRKAPLVLGALSRKPRWVAAVTFCMLLAVALCPAAYWLSFNQGRWAGEAWPSSPREMAAWMAGDEAPRPEPRVPWPSSLRELTAWMAGWRAPLPKVNPDYKATEKGVVFGWFPDRLNLKDEPIVGKEKWEKAKEEIASRKGGKEAAENGDFVPTIKLDGRDLQAAELSGADLRGVSLSDAVVRGAKLDKVRLDGAVLTGAQLQGATLISAQLQEANLVGAELGGADLGNAHSHGADFSGARLRRARLVGAELQGAKLSGAQLQGANLSFARLHGANLFGAQLQGASLLDATLSGANLSKAGSTGSELGGARLQGAELFLAELQGADLLGAQLQGASLATAQLQGANLSGADLSDSELSGAFVFRTDTMGANRETAAIDFVKANAVEFDYLHINLDGVPLDDSDVKDWIAVATEYAPQDEKARIIERFARLIPLAPPTKPDATEEAKWDSLSGKIDPRGAEYRQQLAKRLSELACDRDGAPYVARGLINVPEAAQGVLSPHLAALGEEQLPVVRKHIEEGRENPEKCLGVVGFTEDDWRSLEAIKPE
jgi:uncharacterized protein YjbI with pentapeptide repeats